jgi:hypothetical protein
MAALTSHVSRAPCVLHGFAPLRCTPPCARIASLGATMIKIASIFGVLLCASTAFAQTDCRTIQDTAAALSCLERSVKPKAAKLKAATVAVDPMTHVKDAVLKALKDPQSAVFADMTRADRPNARGEPMDTVCGTVNAKNADGDYNGPKKFVYFIGDSQVYVSGEGQDPELDTILVNSFCK